MENPEIMENCANFSHNVNKTPKTGWQTGNQSSGILETRMSECTEIEVFGPYKQINF